LAESWRDDPELVQLEPIGWYRSRWESPIQLDQDDLRIWNRYFPKPSQVSLVLRVQENSPVRAGFFFRPPHGGPVRIDSSYRTFEIEPWPAESTAGVGALARAVLAGGGGELVRRPPAHPHVPAPPAELFTPPERPSSRPVFFWATAGLAAAGLIGFAKALAREVASRGITVNVVAPGMIDTEMTRVVSEQAQVNWASIIPLGRLGTVDDVAAAVCFLASNEAAYITGHVLAVNGGMYM